MHVLYCIVNKDTHPRWSGCVAASCCREVGVQRQWKATKATTHALLCKGWRCPCPCRGWAVRQLEGFRECPNPSGWQTCPCFNRWKLGSLCIVAVLFPPLIADLRNLICTSSCIYLMPCDVDVWWWLVTPDCCMCGLFEIDWLMLWILMDVVLSAYFQLSIDRSFDSLTHANHCLWWMETTHEVYVNLLSG